MQDYYGNTVAMYLAGHRKPIPTSWEHNPSLRNYNGYTVALLLAEYSDSIPPQWEHDPNI